MKKKTIVKPAEMNATRKILTSNMFTNELVSGSEKNY